MEPMRLPCLLRAAPLVEAIGDHSAARGPRQRALGSPVDDHPPLVLRDSARGHRRDMPFPLQKRENRQSVGEREVVVRRVNGIAAIVHGGDVELGRDRFEVGSRQGNPPAHEEAGYQILFEVLSLGAPRDDQVRSE
jgi:hypothetical protein